MARLPYIASTESPELVAAEPLYAQIRGLGRPLAHLYQVLANQPPALAAFLGMSRYIRDSSSLSPRLREIAILATGVGLGQPYEIAQHGPIALKAGVSQEELDSLLAGDGRLLSDSERAVVAYARDVAERRDVDDATFGALASHFSRAELVDIVMTVAWYHLCAAILGPLRVEIEAGDG